MQNQDFIQKGIGIRLGNLIGFPIMVVIWLFTLPIIMPLSYLLGGSEGFERAINWPEAVGEWWNKPAEEKTEKAPPSGPMPG